jgi:NitT/TauT family transport system ATP-binding protein
VLENKPLPEPKLVLECRKVSHWFEQRVSADNNNGGASNGGANGAGWFGKRLLRRVNVLYDVNLKVARGEFVALVGSSGVGKSTLLRAILGTHPPRSGQIVVNDQVVTSPGRQRGIVYQRYSLFPYLTAQENVAFGPLLDQLRLIDRIFLFWKYRKLRRQHLEQAAELLTKFGLEGELGKYPSELSGGQSQRVAVAQALIMKPEILLLDEPFGALDEAIREEQQDMLLELRNENLEAQAAGRKPPYTVILVTHELKEALKVADRVVALSAHWVWEDEGLPPQPYPGATIVYDAVAPFQIDYEVDLTTDLGKQREEIRKAAFPKDPSVPRVDRDKFVRFWKEYQEGKACGVLAQEYCLGG